MLGAEGRCGALVVLMLESNVSIEVAKVILEKCLSLKPNLLQGKLNYLPTTTFTVLCLLFCMQLSCNHGSIFA